MRVTNMIVERNFLYNISRCEERLLKYQDQASSGCAILRPQDDPVGTSRTISLRHLIFQNEQYSMNLYKARNWLEETEQALEEITSLLIRTEELASSGITGTSPTGARLAIAEEIYQINEEIQTIRDRTTNGRSLLCGTLPVWKLGTGVEITATDQTELLDKILEQLGGLEDGLRNGDVAAMTSSAQELTDCLDNVLAQRSGNGACLRRLDMLEAKAISLDIEYRKSLSNVEDVDLTKLLVQLKSAEAAYEAALGVGARLIQPTLLDHLR